MMRRPTSLIALSLVGAVCCSLLAPFAPGLDSSVQAAQLNQSVKAFGDKNGFELKTVKNSRTYYFTVPKYWKVNTSSAVKVVFQHSNSLIKERSSLNVLVNNRILKSIPLGKDNSEKTVATIPIPPDLLKERNSLSFQVDQHYTYDCEDPFSAELWTTLLPETSLVLNYDKQAIKPTFTAFPYPFVDELGYGAEQLGFVAPNNPSSPTLTALATVASALGSHIGWRDADANLLTPNQVGSGDANMIVVGTPSENPAIGQLKLPVSSSLNTTPDGQTIEENDGVLMLVPHPSKPYRNIVVVTGKTPIGVQKAAQFLAAHPAHHIASGNYVVVKDFSTESRDEYRDWYGFVTKSRDSLADLGQETKTSRGVTAPPLVYPVKRIPDLHFPGNSTIKLNVHYSYASQLDTTQSKLEVNMNGKTLGSIPLTNPEGETNAVATLEFPVQDFYSYNNLEFQFYTYPPKKNACEFVTDAQIWGTIHNRTNFDFLSEVRTSIPDVGLLNDGGFPFSEEADFSNTVIVMPQNPNTAEENTLLQLMLRLGKEAPFSEKKLPVVVRPDQLNGEMKQEHVIVIGRSAVNALKGEFQDKYRLVIENKTANLEDSEGALATVTHNTEVGILEGVLSPWNDKRMLLLAYGESPTAQQNVANLFKKDDAFQAIQEGNITLVNPDGQVRSLTAMKRGDARLVYDRQKEGMTLPAWLVFVMGFLGIVGLLTILGGLFAGKKK